MKPIIKNQMLKTVLRERNEKDLTGTVQEKCFAVIGGYVCSLLQIAEDLHANLVLDCTYGSIKNLATAVVWEFSSYFLSKDSTYSVEDDIEIAEKTIASYLMCLALNEENATIITKESPERSIETVYSPVRWSGYDILASHRMITIDFLKEIHGSVYVTDNKVTVEMDAAIKAYKQLVGKDLALYGVDGVIGELPQL